MFLQLLCNLTNEESQESTKMNNSTAHEINEASPPSEDTALRTVSETVDTLSREHVIHRKLSQKATRVLKKLHSICLVCRSDMCVCSISSAGSQVTAL